MPFAALGAVILQALGEIGTITLYRYAVGTQNQTTGHFVEGVATTAATDAVVNPFDMRTRAEPEGERAEEWVEVFTLAALRDARSGAQADEFTWNGRRFRVMECDDWTTTAGYAYSKAVRIGAD